MKELMNLEQFWDSLKEQNDNVRVEIETADESIKIIKEIVNARIKMNLSQRELAKKCGIKQPALARIESFKVSPTLPTLIKLAKYVNIKIEVLKSDDVVYIYKEQKTMMCDTQTLNIKYINLGGITYGNQC